MIKFPTPKADNEEEPNHDVIGIKNQVRHAMNLLYVREYSPDVGLPPERHLAYAFQWVALGLAVFGVWLVVNLRRGRKSEVQP